MTGDRLVDDLLGARRTHGVTLPDPRRVHQFVEDLVELLFPHFTGHSEGRTREDITSRLATLTGDLRQLVGPIEPRPGHADAGPGLVVDRFLAALPDTYRRLWLDAEAMFAGDPAAGSLDEVIATYPGFFAIYTHRVAHTLERLRVPILPRAFAEYAHRRTGIDIHPGARIGERCCIDHGTGIVIGQTAEIGSSVKIYQGVSLGALSVTKAMTGAKRHPTIEDHVVIYANATILGGRTTIGHHSVIGGNVWLTESVPPHSVVQHRSEVHVRSRRRPDEPIDFSI